MLTPVIDVSSTSRYFLFQTVKAFDQVSDICRSFRYISGIKDSLQTQPDEDLLISYFTYAAETKPH